VVVEDEVPRALPVLVPWERLHRHLELPIPQRLGEELPDDHALAVDLRQLFGERRHERPAPVLDQHRPADVLRFELDVEVDRARPQVGPDAPDALAELPVEDRRLGQVELLLDRGFGAPEVLVQFVGEPDQRGDYPGTDALVADELLVGEPLRLQRDVLAAAVAHHRGADDVAVARIHQVGVLLLLHEHRRDPGVVLAGTEDPDVVVEDRQHRQEQLVRPEESLLGGVAADELVELLEDPLDVPGPVVVAARERPRPVVGLLEQLVLEVQVLGVEGLAGRPLRPFEAALDSQLLRHVAPSASRSSGRCADARILPQLSLASTLGRPDGYGESGPPDRHAIGYRPPAGPVGARDGGDRPQWARSPARDR
jgi:hypothetical protein